MERSEVGEAEQGRVRAGRSSGGEGSQHNVSMVQRR
jgi:hypothetical protein